MCVVLRSAGPPVTWRMIQLHRRPALVRCRRDQPRRCEMTASPAQTVRVDAQRIGFLSDTHTTAADGGDLPAQLLDAFADVDLIVHLGHIQSPGTLDRLEQVAPVLAVQTALDDKLFGEAMAAERQSGRTSGTTRILEAGGLRIGLVHNF